ncbi:hypothetical protein D3C87_126020 [compost metagenome]
MSKLSQPQSFYGYPPKIKKGLTELRSLIGKVAERMPLVGPIEETIRWGQLTFLTSQSKSGSMIRIDRHKGSDKTYAMYFHCQTNLVSSFRKLFGNKLMYEGNRALLFDVDQKIPRQILVQCIEMALTYHLSNASKKDFKNSKLIH